MKLLPISPLSADRGAPRPSAASRLLSCAVALAVFFLTTAAGAQTIYTRDGQAVASQGLRRDGDSVIARIQTPGGSPGDIGYPVTNIERIAFPEPAQIKLAGDLLNAGRADEALRQITPVIAYYLPFRDISGNWWTQLALHELDAFTRLGKDRDANGLISDLMRMGGLSPENLRAIKIKQAAGSERAGDHQRALDTLDPILKDTTLPPATLTEGWLIAGQARLAQRDYRAALLAFLHVPVYTPDKAFLMAPALLDSANAFIGLEDGQRAQSALKDLIAAYPNSPEAARGRDRLKAIAAPAPKSEGG